MSDKRGVAPAAGRNVEPIGNVLGEWLPPAGVVLELASGTGEHALAFARRFPQLDWQPTDQAAEAIASIAAWRSDGPPNLLAPVLLDCAADRWPISAADALLCINMVHISPWRSSLGLIAGASRLLAPGAPLILYGPWIEDEVATVPSNLVFNADLKARNPEWGLRRVTDFAAAAEEADLWLADRRALPANNIMLRFDRR